MKKPVKLGLWLIGFAVLALLGLWLEHERAKARLAAFKAQLVAKGEKLAIADHVPKLPNALSNAAPDFIAAANRLTELKTEFQPQRMRLIAPGRALVTWQQAELPTDKDPDIRPILIAHVAANRPLLAEMATALERPEMVFNLDYSKGFSLLLPHLSKVKQAANNFAIAAIIDLHMGQTNSAFTNLLAASRMSQSFQEPLLISQLVRIACGQIVQQTTWEALQHVGWSDAQLRELQRAWKLCELRSGWLGSLSMERGISVISIQQCRGNSELLWEFTSWGPSHSGRGFFEELFDDPGKAAMRVPQFTIHVAWSLWLSYPDERWMLEHQQIWHEGARRMWTNQSFSATDRWMKTEVVKLGEQSRWLHMLSGMIVPGVENYHKKMATFETTRRLTFTAIALHRHRLKHGKFPESLGALVPEFLTEVPRDFMDGQPLRYKLQPDGQFLLWSVGEDFKDDGGDAMPLGVASGSSNLPDWLKGRDWVWPQAATEAEVAAHHAELEAKRAGSAPKNVP